MGTIRLVSQRFLLLLSAVSHRLHAAFSPDSRLHQARFSRLDELHLIAFRVLRVKPAAPIARRTNVTHRIHTVRAQILQHSGRIFGVVRDASHPAQVMVWG